MAQKDWKKKKYILLGVGIFVLLLIAIGSMFIFNKTPTTIRYSFVTFVINDCEDLNIYPYREDMINQISEIKTAINNNLEIYRVEQTSSSYFSNIYGGNQVKTCSIYFIEP